MAEKNEPQRDEKQPERKDESRDRDLEVQAENAGKVQGGLWEIV